MREALTDLKRHVQIETGREGEITETETGREVERDRERDGERHRERHRERGRRETEIEMRDLLTPFTREGGGGGGDTDRVR